MASNEVSEIQDMLAQFKTDVEIDEACIIMMSKYVKRLSRMEALEDVQAPGIDFNGQY